MPQLNNLKKFETFSNSYRIVVYTKYVKYEKFIISPSDNQCLIFL